jgi:hypothetical protein
MSGTPARTATGFDFSRVSRGVWISAIGAFVLLISVFFDWYSGTVSISGVPGGFNGSASKSVSGTSATDVAWFVFLLALIALAAWAIELFVDGVDLPFPAWMVAGACGGLSLLLILFRIVDKPGGLGTNTSGTFGSGSSKISWSVSTSFGIWLALLAAIAVIVGAYLTLNEESSVPAREVDAPSDPSPAAAQSEPPPVMPPAPPAAPAPSEPPPPAPPTSDVPPPEGPPAD